MAAMHAKSCVATLVSTATVAECIHRWTCVSFIMTYMSDSSRRDTHVRYHDISVLDMTYMSENWT